MNLKPNNRSELDKTNKGLLKSTTESILSTRNRPSGPLLGEKNSSIKPASLLLPTKTVQKSSRASQGERDEQRSRQSNVNNNNPPSEVDQQPSTISQGQQQSMIFDESMELTTDMDRLVVIDDTFFHSNASVFDIMGPKQPQSRTYSDVAGSKGNIQTDQQHYPTNSR